MFNFFEDRYLYYQ